MSDDLSTRLARWSQRKLAADRGEVVPAETEDTTAKVALDIEQQPAASDLPAHAGEAPGSEPDADGTPADDTDKDGPKLPSIDELDAKSDYTVFLAKGVPEALTRAALRKLWVSDPVLANLDGLNNYDEDYNVVDQIITTAQTSYRPGLGYIDEIEKQVAKLDETLAQIGGKPAESPVDSGVHEREKISKALRDSDAPQDEPAGAPQQLASVEPEKTTTDSEEESGEAVKSEEAEDDTGK